MKMRNSHKNFLLAFLILYFLSLGNIIICNLKTGNNHFLDKQTIKANENNESPFNKESSPFPIHKIRGHKIHKKDHKGKSGMLLPKIKISSSHKLYDQENLLKVKKTESDNNNNDNETSNLNSPLAYVSWLVFIPLFFLIFIMTILSIAGFFILILNSVKTGISTPQHTAASMRRSRLSTSELLDLLRLKLLAKKKQKKGSSNKRPEPEPEGIVYSESNNNSI